eukprot:3282730-Amphidinium_carterae.1
MCVAIPSRLPVLQTSNYYAMLVESLALGGSERVRESFIRKTLLKNRRTCLPEKTAFHKDGR